MKTLVKLFGKADTAVRIRTLNNGKKQKHRTATTSFLETDIVYKHITFRIDE